MWNSFFTKNIHNRKLTSLIQDRLNCWNRGEFLALWTDARSEIKDREEIIAVTTSLSRSNIRKAIRLCENGRLSKAVAALMSYGVAPPSEETFVDMLKKHPQAVRPPLPNVCSSTLPTAAVVDEDTVKGKVWSFCANSARSFEVSTTISQGHLNIFSGKCQC